MPKVFSRVRNLRLRLSVRRGHNVTIGEAAEGIGITRVALSRLENDQTEQVSFDTLEKLLTYYRRELGEEGLTAGDVLGYDPNKMRAPELAAAFQP